MEPPVAAVTQSSHVTYKKQLFLSRQTCGYLMDLYVVKLCCKDKVRNG